MAETAICADCGKTPPQTETNYTLIGSQHGWRLIREKQPDGTYEVTWHCRECWKNRKTA